jgi:hypothetical protein
MYQNLILLTLVSSKLVSDVLEKEKEAEKQSADRRRSMPRPSYSVRHPNKPSPTTSGGTDGPSSGSHHNSPNGSPMGNPTSPTSSTSTLSVGARSLSPSPSPSPSSMSPQRPDSGYGLGTILGSGVSSPNVNRQAPPSVSNLQDDLATKEEFKYSAEVEAIAQRWIEAVLKEKFPSGVSFADHLKSGVILCRCVNTK